MKKRIYVFTVALFLLLSGMLVAVGGEARSGRDVSEERAESYSFRDEKGLTDADADVDADAEIADPISTGLEGADVPNWGIGSSWTYDQEVYIDLEGDYLEWDEEVTYTVEDIRDYTYDGETYYAYELDLDGEVDGGGGEFDGHEVDIDGGDVDGELFLRVSDLGIIREEQERDLDAEADSETWVGWVDIDPFEIEVERSYDPVVEEYDFPMRDGETFDADTTIDTRAYYYADVQYDDTYEDEYEESADMDWTREISDEERDGYDTYKADGGLTTDWYSEEVGWNVEHHTEFDADDAGADMERELKSYDPKSPGHSQEIDPNPQYIGSEVTVSGEMDGYSNTDLLISIPYSGEDEWEVSTDTGGNYEKTIEVPEFEDNTPTDSYYASEGVITYVEGDKSEKVVTTLVTQEGHEGYDLTVDSTDGGTVVEPGEGTHGPYDPDTVVDLEAEADDDWVFDEWTGDVGFVGDTDSSETYIRMEDDYSIIANFDEEETYTLDLDSSSGGSVTEPGEGTHGPYNSGTVVDLEAEADDGWVFDEWMGDVGFVGDTDSSETFVKMEDDYSITANFEDKTYTLDLDSGSGGSVTEPGEGTYSYDPDTVVDLEAEADDGWAFDEWTGDVGFVGDTDSSETFVRMEDDYSITANFVTADEYELTVDSTDGGTVVEPGEGTYNYEPGITVDLEAEADDGWAFDEWTEDTEEIDDPTEADTSIEMNDDYSITANFVTVDEYDLTVDSTEGGEVVEPGEDTYSYEAGTPVDLEAEAEEGWVFDEWTGDVGFVGDTDSSETFVRMEDDYSITANFVEEHDLTVDSTEGGEVVEPGEGTYSYGTGREVDLVAEADDGWFFDEWTGDIETIEYPSSAETELVMEDDYTIQAEFDVAEETYILDLNSTSGGSVIEPGEDTYSYEAGTRVDLVAEADDDSQFVGWTGDVDTVEDPSSAETELVMEDDYTIKAGFDDVGAVYTLDLTIEGEGTVDIEPDKEEYEPGEEVDLTAIPDEDWYFAEWGGDASGTEEEITLMMDEDKEITALFEEEGEERFTLTIKLIGEGSTEPSAGNHSYEEGQEVTITATAEEGWYFDEWTGDYTGAEGEITVTMDDDKEITAVFEEVGEDHFALTIDIEGEGSTEPPEGSHTYEEGKEITITAAAAEDWSFVEWKGDHTSTDEEITITIDEDKEITAIFELSETGIFEVDVTGYDRTVREGEEIRVEYAVTNIGEGEGTQDIEFWVDDEKLDWVTLTLGPGEDHTGEFNWTSEETGQYELEISGADSRDVVRVTVEEEVESDDDDESDDSSSLSDYWWLITLIVIGGVIAVGMAMAVRKRESSSQQSSQQEVVPLLSQIKSSKEETSQQQQAQKAQRSSRQQKSQRAGGSSLLASEEKKHECPKCGGEVRYIEEYDRWYCDSCQGYKSMGLGSGAAGVGAREEGKQESNACPDCGSKLRYIEEYDRWYCDSCQGYKLVQAGGREAGGQGEQESNACPDCGSKLRYIEEYDRWYCDSCQGYKSVQAGGREAGEQGKQESNACPDCGGKMRYIEEYDRWYCDSCQEYQ